MSIVNVRVKYIRPKYQNLKEWMQHPNNVYIGRKRIVFIDGQRFPPNDSTFANPFKIGKNCNTLEESIEKYKKHLMTLIETNPNVKKELSSLKGKTLGCWCKPKPCHGDILLKLIDECKL